MNSPEQTELAENRTDLAEDRTVLAHERSFAGWVRTGMVAVGIGLGFSALFRTMEPAWLPKSIATTFLIVAMFIFVSAERRARTLIDRLEPHKVSSLKPMRIRILSAALVGAAVVLAATIWIAAGK